jgi:uroporphyrinogen decarboxylase
MLSRERVFLALEHKEPDRVPIYIWTFGNPIEEPINEKYGSLNAFFDQFSIDMVQVFPGEGILAERPTSEDLPDGAVTGGANPKNCYGNIMTVEQALDAKFTDPAAEAIYEPIRRAVEYHKGEKGRAIWVQTPGVFETSAGLLGLQGALECLITEPGKMHELFRKIATWARSYVDHCIDIGVDTIHISDDWGRNDAMLFSPKLWWEHVFPNERIHASRARERGAYLSLHCDGYFWDVIDGVIELGVQVTHPIQQSAGMDMVRYKKEFGDRLTIYGGLDVRTTLGTGDIPKIRREVRDRMRQLKPGGGYIFCTSHMVQPHTTLEEVEAALETALEEARY